jgi:methyl-accepting chemotaxis protein
MTLPKPTIEAPSKNLARRLDEISKSFDIAVSTADELTEAIEEEFKEEIETSETLKTLKDDFDFSRKTLKETVKTAQRVLDSVAGEIDNGLDIKASMITSYAELVGIVNSSLKLLSDIYRNMTDVQLKIKKQEREERESSSQEGVTGVSVTHNNLIVTDVKSILEEMKNG